LTPSEGGSAPRWETCGRSARLTAPASAFPTGGRYQCSPWLRAGADTRQLRGRESTGKSGDRLRHAATPSDECPDSPALAFRASSARRRGERERQGPHLANRKTYRYPD
jgi:hypothetical protein